MNPVVEIQQLGHRGVGIGRHSGKVVMVPLTAPGDRVEVRIARSHGSYDEGRLVRVLEPSPLRRDPPCPHFGQCGGCQLQHMEVAHQRAAKARLFREMLTHGKAAPEEALGPMLHTPGEFAYRSRLELQVMGMPRPLLGFKALGSSHTVPIDRCLLAMPALHPFLGATRRVLEEARVRDAVRLEMACDAPGSGVTLTLRTLRPLSRRVVEALAGEVAGWPGLRGAYWTQGRGEPVSRIWSDGGETRGVRYAVRFSREAKESTLEVWPGVFVQVNPSANRLLVETAVSWLEGSPPGRILDLYAGMGNLTFPLSRLARAVVAVEINPMAVENGQANGRRLGIDHVRWVRASAAAGVRRLLESGERFDLVVLDPPRSGAREILEGAMALAPRQLLYVSCDPATLARDLGRMRDGGTYEMVRTQPLDMFPQTFHLESITLLQRMGDP